MAAIRLKAQEHAENLRSILDDIRGDGTTSVRQIAEELNCRGILAPRGGDRTRQPLCGCSIDFKGKRLRRVPTKARAVASYPRIRAGALWPRQIPSLVHGHLVHVSRLFGRLWQCARRSFDRAAARLSPSASTWSSCLPAGKAQQLGPKIRVPRLLRRHVQPIQRHAAADRLRPNSLIAARRKALERPRLARSRCAARGTVRRQP